MEIKKKKKKKIKKKKKKKHNLISAMNYTAAKMVVRDIFNIRKPKHKVIIC